MSGVSFDATDLWLTALLCESTRNILLSDILCTYVPPEVPLHDTKGCPERHVPYVAANLLRSSRNSQARHATLKVLSGGALYWGGTGLNFAVSSRSQRLLKISRPSVRFCCRCGCGRDDLPIERSQIRLRDLLIIEN